jgi:putative salt-induced outer membrane protein YdiY
MSNGDWLSGAVVTMGDGILVLETEYAGEIELDWAQASRLILDEPMPAVLVDGVETEARELPSVAIGLADVEAIAPPQPSPPPPVRWRGRVAFGWASTSGNSSSRLSTLTALAERERPDRYRLSLLLDAAEGRSEGEATADRARLQGKYDRGTGGSNYRYYLAGIGYDKVRDIDLRTEVGAGIGRTLIDEPDQILTAEVGASFVRDDYSDGVSESDAKVRIGESWTRDLNAATAVRQTLALLAVADDPRDYTAELMVALTNQLWDNVAVTSKVVDTYESRPAPGTERNDLTFTLQVGYAFGD